MQHDYDDEMQEVIAHVNTAKQILQDAIADIDAIVASETDVENVSNDTFVALANMLRALKNDANYCIETLVEDAMQDE